MSVQLDRSCLWDRATIPGAIGHSTRREDVLSTKEIGRLARIELNDLWQRSVHLELWVKVKENWADSEMALRQFGYDTL